MRCEIYKDKRGEWRWHVISSNGRIRAVSSEGYIKKQAAIDCFLDVVGMDVDDRWFE